MMPGPKAILDEPKARKKAVALLARGRTKAAVAREFGVARSTVSTWTSKESVRQWIEQEARRYLESLPDALEISRNLLRAGKMETAKLTRPGPSTIDHKLIDSAAREAENMRKAVGIQPTNTTGIMINNILLAPNAGLSPILAQLLATVCPPALPPGETSVIEGEEGDTR
jgi:transposase-like protein